MSAPETREAEWIAQARKLRAEGAEVLEVARQLGKSTDGIRYALDLNGAREKKKARVKRSRAKERAERVTTKPQRTARSRVLINAEREGRSTYADPKPARPLTLPKISLPDIDEPRLLRIAPRSIASESPGVERWREAHQRMIRRGLIAEPSDLIQSLSH